MGERLQFQLTEKKMKAVKECLKYGINRHKGKNKCKRIWNGCTFKYRKITPKMRKAGITEEWVQFDRLCPVCRAQNEEIAEIPNPFASDEERQKHMPGYEIGTTYPPDVWYSATGIKLPRKGKRDDTKGIITNPKRRGGLR